MKATWIYLLLCSGFLLQAQSPKRIPKTFNGMAGVYCNTVKTDAKPWAKNKDLPWDVFEAYTLNGLSDYHPKTSKFGQFGSDQSKKFTASGFFRAEKQGNRWWVIDPNGYRTIVVGINSLRAGKSESNLEALAKKYNNPEQWMNKTIDTLQQLGFFHSGSWGDDEAIRKHNASSKNAMTYCPQLNWMSGYGKKRGGTYQKAGNTGYPHDVIFVFDPAFKTYCDSVAVSLATHRNDPNLFGYFSDNEMPLGNDNLDNYLAIENHEDFGYKRATQWLTEQGITADKITDKVRESFAGFVAQTYYSIVSEAIKKNDPNHLYLGSRLHADAKRNEGVLEAAGKYCDIISLNYYGDWSPDPIMVDQIDRKANKPFMVTEFYTKGMDSGLANTTGAGFTVKTQTDRGNAYQHFCLHLLNSKSCVGWHYFKYQDNDPKAKNVDPSNVDSNKGLVNTQYQFYKPLIQLMKTFNVEKYDLIQYLETESPKVKALEPLDIILAIGQSNMAGRGPIPAEDSGVMPNVYLLNRDLFFEPAAQPLNKYSTIRKELRIQGVSPSYKCMLDIQTKTNKSWGLVMNPQGGSSIKLWYKPGKANYDATLLRAREAQKHGKLRAIIWNQGSTDNKDAKADDFVTYKAQLKEMVAHLREDLKEPTLPFICGELSERPDFIEFNQKVIRTVKDYIPYSDFVTSEDTHLLEDNIHFDAESANKMGVRYAQKVLEMINK